MNICCKAGLVVLHSSSFFLSVKSLISLSSLFKLSFKIASNFEFYKVPCHAESEFHTG